MNGIVKNRRMRSIAYCPECGAEVRLKEIAEIGARVRCPKCGERLDVVQVRPPELDYAYEEG